MMATKQLLKVELHKEDNQNVNVYFLPNSVDITFYSPTTFGTLVMIPRSSFEANQTADLRERIKQLLTELINQL